jgi:cation diffusion facilitator family transporter
MSHRSRLQTATLAIVVGVVVLGLKVVAAWMTGSSALKSDALESVVNVLSACFALGAVLWSNRPADRDHPYGHGKIEFFSASFVGGLITLAAVVIVLEAAQALWFGPQLKQLGLGLVINLGAGALNGLLGWRLIYVGRKTRSPALEADGYHVLADFYTTLGLFAGLLIVRATGLAWIDPVMALFVGLLLARTGVLLLKNAADALMDREDKPLLSRIMNWVNRWEIPAVISIHRLRAIRSGSFTHVDVHVLVPEYLDVRQGHKIMHDFADQLLADCDLHGELHTHMEPCRQAYCSVCPDQACPIRLKPYQSRRPLSIEAAVSHQESPPND